MEAFGNGVGVINLLLCYLQLLLIAQLLPNKRDCNENPFAESPL